jgi:hypothetical protein
MAELLQYQRTETGSIKESSDETITGSRQCVVLFIVDRAEPGWRSKIELEGGVG